MFLIGLVISIVVNSVKHLPPYHRRKRVRQMAGPDDYFRELFADKIWIPTNYIGNAQHKQRLFALGKNLKW